MSLTITAVPDIKYVLGQSGRLQQYALTPGASDYPTSGWPITADQLELGQLIGATIVGTNPAGQLYTANFVFPATSADATPQPSTSVNLVVSLGGTQVANGTDLSLLAWFAQFLGW